MLRSACKQSLNSFCFQLRSYESLGISVHSSLKLCHAGPAENEYNKGFRAELVKEGLNKGNPCAKCNGMYKRYKRETYMGYLHPFYIEARLAYP